VFRIERERAALLLLWQRLERLTGVGVLDSGGKVWITAILLQRGGADQMAVLHQVMLLRARQRISVAGLLDLQTAAEPRRGGGTQSVGVETGVRANSASRRSTITEVDRDALVGMARQDPGWGFQVNT